MLLSVPAGVSTFVFVLWISEWASLLQSVIFAVFILLPMLAAAFIARVIYVDYRRSKSVTCCPSCQYTLRGLRNDIRFEASVRRPPSSGPDTCPECGHRWPLLNRSKSERG
ncbi:MAG: hypothetical protein AB8F26_07060 [Phycisphaerales bacterium]